MPAIWAAAIGAVGSVASANMKSGGGGGASGGQPTSWADAKSTQAMFDNSGWNVSFGNNSPITSTAQKTASQDNTPLQTNAGYGPAAASLGNGNWTTYLIVALVVLVIIKHKKKKG
ncbi:hypothetical protein [Dechloromonas sp. HYN0024]|uniref:hypothetical protein n=1 Tax=Dechloromonas sp. HYN0024 TaxID=2231055 RepID=UPI000E44710D|nr:hypothetical protein [Dechloromonas sp. HYN0024]AXS79860.1 hypothetical protein HYN24_07420 [Dechloromonas sp. HYN0024]